MIKKNIIRFYIWIVIFLIIFQFNAFAQIDTITNFPKVSFIEPSFNYGFIMPHRPSMRYNIISHIPAFEIRLSKQQQGEKFWHQYYRFPQTGLGVYYASLENPKVLGHVYALYAFINIPIMRRNNYTFNYEISSGAAYLDKPYDNSKNYYNVSIGSGLNFSFNFSFDYKLKLFKRLDLVNRINIKHFSNGAFKVPNQGINVISYNLGLNYKLNSNKPSFKRVELQKFAKKNEFYAVISGGSKEIPPPEIRNYPTASLSVNLLRQISRQRKIGFGTDIFYDESLRTTFINKKMDYKNIEMFRGGIFLSHELVFSKVGIIVQSGVYYFSKLESDGLFYHRIGIRYFMNNNFILNFALKSHFARADFIEFGVGYKIF
ncbi:MAG: hypothetical protein A2046_15055 [Bacteroidetes bacterium GWA2_30_7]|nr:MAG: hypothetical protein A2046_15055 [Bacteroidetes bacterium GWA2_30_7]